MGSISAAQALVEECPPSISLHPSFLPVTHRRELEEPARGRERERERVKGDPGHKKGGEVER